MNIFDFSHLQFIPPAPPNTSWKTANDSEVGAWAGISRFNPSIPKPVLLLQDVESVRTQFVCMRYGVKSPRMSRGCLALFLHE